MSRLLIVSCSERKRHDRSLLPAILRYDGPVFHVLRRSPSDVMTYVLSARFGLIEGKREIPWYDQRLTRARRRELDGSVATSVSEIVGSGEFSSAFICAGADYLDLLYPHLDKVRASIPLVLATGGMGEKLTRLRGWIGPATTSQHQRRPGPVKVRGVNVSATRDQLIAIAEDAVRTDHHLAQRCHGWHVPAAGGRVSPKWLISQVTGLPVGRFHSDDARRVLDALGVEMAVCA